MTTVRCPRCHDEVTMPPRAGKQTHVRCPLCLEDYLLEEALRQAPPMLEVIGGELEPAMAAAPAAYSGMSDLDAGLSPAGQAADGGFSFAPDAAGQGVFGTTGPAAGEAVAPARGVRESTRPKRKQKSALGTIVGVVLGGGLGVALAPLAIWWIAGTDPFDLAPKVPASLQFVLPQKLQTQGGSSSVATNNNPPLTNNSIRPPVVPNNVPNTPTNDTPMLDPLATDPGDLANVTPSVPEVMPADPLATGNPIPTRTTPDENPESVPEPVKPATNTTDVPPVDDRKATELIATLTAARGAAENFASADPADKEERKRLAVELYEAACQLGPQLATVNLQDAAISSSSDDLREFVASQASTPGQINMLGFLAGKRLDDPASPPGILLAGKVIGMQAAGKKFATTLAVGKAMREVVVVTAQNPQDVCNVDDTVVVLGSIERDPSTVEGYEGAAETVVASGYLQKAE